MSSRVAVMRNGAIEQIDTPTRIFHDPANEFVYTFIGESCCLRVNSTDQPLDLTLETALPPGDARLYIRPSRLRMGAEALALPNRLKARVKFVEFLGDTNRYHLQAGAVEIFADHAGEMTLAPGSTVDLGWLTADMRVFR